jgi:hypothetical protein
MTDLTKDLDALWDDPPTSTPAWRILRLITALRGPRAVDFRKPWTAHLCGPTNSLPAPGHPSSAASRPTQHRAALAVAPQARTRAQ